MSTLWLVLVVLCLSWEIPDSEAEEKNVPIEFPFNLPVAKPERNWKKGWNETCIVYPDDVMNVTGFVNRCQHKGRLLSSQYKKKNCITMDMSRFNETQFNKVFRHAVEILGITMVFNNTNHVFLKMENLRWWHKTEQGSCTKGNVQTVEMQQKCLHDRFYKSYERCDHVMVIENNPFLEHILIYRHTLDKNAPHPRRKITLDVETETAEIKEHLPIVIRNNTKLDPTFFLKMGMLFKYKQLSDHFRQSLTCHPSVPLKSLSELKGCRHVLTDLIIDGSTDMNMSTAHIMHIKIIDGCFQIKNTQWKSHQVTFINTGTQVMRNSAAGCIIQTHGVTELTGNKDLCLTYPLWYIFQEKIGGNKDGAECETPVEKNCQGREITTTSDLLRLERCTVITGSLTVKGLTIQFPRHLKAMNDIEKIEGMLTVENCTVKHIMMASLKTVGAKLDGLKIRIKNIKGLKTVNMPSLWIGVNRGKDIEISGCRGYRRPIHLGGTFNGKQYVGREVVPLHTPEFPAHYSTGDHLWFTKGYGIAIAFGVCAIFHGWRVYRRW